MPNTPGGVPHTQALIIQDEPRKSKGQHGSCSEVKCGRADLMPQADILTGRSASRDVTSQRHLLDPQPPVVELQSGRQVQLCTSTWCRLGTLSSEGS